MEESILTASEKEYLSNVIKPFRKKSPITIGKYVSGYVTDEEYIIIWMSNIDNPDIKEIITFPYFKAGEMYRGMEIDKEYSLEELGLWPLGEQPMLGATLEIMGGSKMNLTTAFKALDEGEKIRRKTWASIKYIQLDKDRKLVDDLGQEVSFLCTSDDVGTDCWEVIEKPPLTDQEREYLKAVVKPFRDRVYYIRKENDDEDNTQFIFIAVKKYGEGNEGISEYINFPYFEKGTMYVNMKVNKNYTLEELGL